MLAGPIFTREVLIAPRQVRHFLVRAGYAAALFVLIYTAGQATFGWQQTNTITIGETSRFGSLLFQLFSTIQLALAIFFAPLFAAGRVAQEKDRQTLILLLMTDLRNRELVAGKLLASLLPIAVLLATSLPVFALVYLLGGISLDQIGWSLALCSGAALAAGSWGSLVAFWREKTFQTLAASTVGLLLFLGATELIVTVLGPASTVGAWVALFNPFRGMAIVLDPLALGASSAAAASGARDYVTALVALAVVLNLIAIWRVRIWNPSQAIFEKVALKDEAAAPVVAKTRRIWNNPIIWREICTKAYGRKTVLIKLAYGVLFLLAALYVRQTQAARADLVLGMIAPFGAAFVVLGFVSLLLVNALAVTALTTERDAKTLELLLVTDVSAREFIFGKLGGVLYNTRELILLPLAGLAYYGGSGLISWENFLYLALGFLLLVAFAAMLGLHGGLSFDNSRSAIANSLGTMFFLFLGVFVCMMLIVEARSSFILQLPSFLVFILGGSMGLWASLTHKNPSPALTLSSLLLPFFTFYAVTGFLLADTLGIWIVVTATYGFTILAMLIPAISEFDVALGRTTLDKG